MDDLLIPPGPGAPNGIRIPSIELIERFSRSSGPGGQGVNTTDSRVQLSVDLATTTALDHAQRSRALDNLAARLNDGVLTIAVATERAQRRNRALARQRLAALLREAVTPETPRRPTRPSRASQRRRLDSKSRRSLLKSHRRRPTGD